MRSQVRTDARTAGRATRAPAGIALSVGIAIMPLVVGVGLMLDRPRFVDKDIDIHVLRGSLDPDVSPTPPLPARGLAGHASRQLLANTDLS